MKCYVYILTNEYNRVLYVGVTNDMCRRLEEHKQGINDGFTKRYNAHKLIYAEAYENIETAIKREKQIKHMLREQKIALINAVNPKWQAIEPW